MPRPARQQAAAAPHFNQRRHHQRLAPAAAAAQQEGVQEEGGAQYDAWGDRIEEGEIGLMADDLYTEEMPDGIEGKAGGQGWGAGGMRAGGCGVAGQLGAGRGAEQCRQQRAKPLCMAGASQLTTWLFLPAVLPGCLLQFPRLTPRLHLLNFH